MNNVRSDVGDGWARRPPTCPRRRRRIRQPAVPPDCPWTAMTVLPVLAGMAATVATRIL